MCKCDDSCANHDRLCKRTIDYAEIAARKPGWKPALEALFMLESLIEHEVEHRGRRRANVREGVMQGENQTALGTTGATQ